jgi:hypothetical protein
MPVSDDFNRWLLSRAEFSYQDEYLGYCLGHVRGFVKRDF